MQDVNNDMDDWFRNAAGQYPLKTDGKDWDKVLAGLQDAGAPVAADANNKEKRKKRLLWLLLLLPLGLLYAGYYHYSASQKGENIVLNKDITAGGAVKKETAGNDKTTVNKVPEAKQQANVILPDNKKDSAVGATNQDIQSSLHHTKQDLYQHDGATVANKDVEQNKASYSLTTGSTAKGGKEQQQKEEKEIFDNSISNPATAEKENEKPANGDKNNALNRQPTEFSPRIQNAITTDSGEHIAAKQNDITTDTVSTYRADSAVAKSESSNNKKTGKIIAVTHHQQGLYAGLSGSFDISNIRLQRINKVGYGLNVLAGYRFSKRLSVESGIDWSHKKYFSDGKYFDKTKTGIPNQVKIYFTNGTCNMFEIPVNVKYDFALRKKSNLFVTAGLSSYIMKKESYWYRGNYNMMWEYDTTLSYRNSVSNLFSVANFSIGYQAHLNKNSTLRIEPYVKLPLHGIGIANMPIMSAGISVGFTRKF